jgi:ribonuclease R
LLADMVEEGLIVKVAGDRYKTPAARELVTGRVQVFEGGFAFVVPEEPGSPDLFLPPRAAQGLVQGDRVLARVNRRGPRPSGSVVRVLERAHPRVAGRIERYRRFSIVQPYGARGVGPVSIPQGLEMDAADGVVVVAEVTNFPTEQAGAFGRVVEILGDADDPDVEFQIVALSFGLPIAFAPDAEKEAAECPDRVSPAERKDRRDLREELTVTIDGETARDFDDAVAVEEQGGGRARLRVSIADVAHYVREGTALDREAYGRGTSVYFPDRAIHMLPTALSSGICSLKEAEERLTLTAEMDFDAAGRRTAYRVYESVIRSSARLTYTEVAGALGGEKPLEKRPAGLLDALRRMETLARKLLAVRKEWGSIDFDLPEAEILIDVQGKTEDVVKRQRNIAHRIIEEFMLQANMAVAEFLEARKAPQLYRVHEPPEARDMEEFAELSKAFGFNLDLRRGVRPKDLAGILARVKGRPEEHLINQVLLRSMRQARYSPKNAGHFGLAFDHYCHFTSPIRRYPDLVNHRILKVVLRQGAIPRDSATKLTRQLVDWGDHTSRRERLAMEAERDILALRKAQFMVDKIGQEYDGFVSGVTKFGFFVELAKYFVEGLVPLRTLYDDEYVFHPRLFQLSGRRTKRRISLGDRVTIRVVRVDAVDVQRRTIDFALLARTGESGMVVPTSFEAGAAKAFGGRGGGDKGKGGRKKPGRRGRRRGRR